MFLYFFVESLKVLDRTFKHLHIKRAGHVLVKTVSNTLRVAHLTEYSSVGRGNTFYRKCRIVGLVSDIVGGVAIKINVLCCDLSVCRKLAEKRLITEESSLSVRDRNGVDISYLRTCKPSDLLDAMRVRTSFDWWREIVLNVSVGAFSSGSVILP